MAQPAKRGATYEDLKKVPPHLVAQIIDGELITQPRLAASHAFAASGLGMDLGNPFQRGRGGPGGWVILDEPELHLHGDILVPDLAAWRRERMPKVPDVAAFELPPDWVCEVLSPSTQSMDRMRKMAVYLREQVAHVWLLDPIAKTLEAYQHGGEHWLRKGIWGEEDKVRVEPFDAIELELGNLWER